MATALHSFIDIFETKFLSGEEEVQLRKIVIPIIQRDYAQGRRDPDIERVRARFLDSLFLAVTESPITLDFVYGDFDETGIMTPLDGQQRLTTLFLLHWYAAKRAAIPETEYLFLNQFSYETRYSARDFCSFLVKFQPSFTQQLSDEIINQSWFPLDWKKDPTISSMLVMLDAIHLKFAPLSDLWERLKNGAIRFYFLPIRDMGLTDELYIKMNSRGKPLTQFEHFKAELEREIKTVDPETAKRIMRKVDLDWTDMLWQYRGEDNITDDEFLRYFKFVCDVICYHAGGTPQGKSSDEFDLLKEYFSAENESTAANLQVLEAYFDCWHKLCIEESPDSFLQRFISHNHEPGKVQIDSRYQIDIFKDCLTAYADSTGRRRTFPLNRIVMLYSITAYLLNRDSITEEQFARRLRIVNNLIQNSEDEISDSEARASGNRMPAILAQVYCIITTGTISNTIEKNFNPNQIAEEQAKLIWCDENPDLVEQLFELEDHELLYGQISIVGLDNADCFNRFRRLFACDLDAVDCALMATGFYPQREANKWRYQFGSNSSRHLKAWSELFHQSRNTGFEETRKVLVQLLRQCTAFTNEELRNISNCYIEQCEQNQVFTWRYYYIKYQECRPGSYGKYVNDTPDQQEYLFSVMQTQTYWSENTYIPYFKVADEAHVSRDHKGQRLIYGDNYILVKNDAYVIITADTEEEVMRLPIAQNENGQDTEDRITKLQMFLVSNPA